MGFPFLYEVTGEIDVALSELRAVADKATTWPEELQEVLSAEGQRLAEEIQSLARQIAVRPSGEWPGVLPDTPGYRVAGLLPFATGQVARLEPDYQQWAKDRQTLGRLYEPAVAGERLEVVAYLDTEDERVIDGALDALEHLADLLGFGEVKVVENLRGSIFRRAWAGLKQGLASDEVRGGLAQVERAVYLAGIAVKQAQVDEATATAVQALLTSIQDVPRACMRVGSVLLVKYEEQGQPVVFVRTLSSIEMAALEKFPGIQKDPEHVLQLLAQMVVDQAELERGATQKSATL